VAERAGGNLQLTKVENYDKEGKASCWWTTARDNLNKEGKGVRRSFVCGFGPILVCHGTSGYVRLIAYDSSIEMGSKGDPEANKSEKEQSFFH
jgi:hypothetical protein